MATSKEFDMESAKSEVLCSPDNSLKLCTVLPQEGLAHKDIQSDGIDEEEIQHLCPQLKPVFRDSLHASN